MENSSSDEVEKWIKKSKWQTIHIRRLEAEIKSLGHEDLVQKIRERLSSVGSCPLTYSDDESADGEDIETSVNPHPLLIPVIIKTVSQYLDYNTAKSLRLVHSSWNTVIATPRYFQRTRYALDFLYKKLDGLFEAFPIDVHSHGSEANLARSVTITNFGLLEKPEALINWFETHGKWITRLDVNRRDVENANVLTTVSRNKMMKNKSQIFEELLTGLFPNLEHLQICSMDFSGLLFQTKQPSLQKLKFLSVPICRDSENVMEILKSIPNLEVLKFVRSWTVEVNVGDPLMGYLSTSLEAGYLITLTELHFPKTINLNPRTMEFLGNIEFKNLKRLTIQFADFPQFPTNMYRVSNILDHVKHSLSHLKIGPSFLLKVLPQMAELKELKVYDGFLASATSLEFLVNATTLESFFYYADISQLEADQESSVLSKLFPTDFLLMKNHPLKLLKLTNVIMNQESLQKLVRAFPNLTTLHVKMCKLVTESLRIFRPITGNSNWNVGQFLTVLASLEKLVDLKFTIFCEDMEESQGAINDEISQNVFQLLVLKRLTIHCELGIMKLEKHAVIDGFMKIPSLRYLELKNFIVEPEVHSLIKSMTDHQVQVKVLEPNVNRFKKY